MFVMSIAELFKKNFVLIPVIASVLFGTFTGVKYIVNLTDTINDNQSRIINLQRDLTTAQEKISDQKECVSSGTEWETFASYSRAIKKGNQIHVSGTTATHQNQVVGGADAAHIGENIVRTRRRA